MHRKDKLQYEPDGVVDCISTIKVLAGEVLSRNVTLKNENEELRKKMEQILSYRSFELHEEIANYRSCVMHMKYNMTTRKN